MMSWITQTYVQTYGTISASHNASLPNVVGYMSRTGMVYAKADHQGGGFSELTLLTVIASFVGIYCGFIATQQLISWVRRRKIQAAQDELLNEYKLTKDAESARRDVEQYTARLTALQQQIDKQVPVQARRDYLTERLDQLSRDIYHNFEEYRQVERELGETIPQTAIDDKIRKVIETAIIPKGKLQEQRATYTLLLVLALILITISPLNINGQVGQYFYITDYSDQWPVQNVLSTVVVGVVVLTGLFLLLKPLITATPRIQRFLTWAGRRQIVLIALVLLIILIAIGVSARQMSVDTSRFSNSNPIFDAAAGWAFNIAVLIAAIVITGVWSNRHMRSAGGRYGKLFGIRNKAIKSTDTSDNSTHP